MPRITKEAKSENEKEEKKTAKTTKETKTKSEKSTTKKASTSSTKTKKETTTAKKSTTSKTTTKTTKAVATAKSTKTTKSEESKKTTKTTKATKTATKSTKTASATKPKKSSTSTTTKKTSTKKTTKKVKTASPEDFSIAEYYDLPWNYNKTVVKLLAQTPNTLFVYWEISDDDRKKYVEQYGDNFFEVTKPVLIVYNDSMNYSFEVDINDFANCWYLNVDDSNCLYRIELGRRPIKNNTYINSNNINENYIYVSSSNKIESPNDHILFDKEQQMVYFKNVKTNNIDSKSINFSYMRNLGKIYNIYDIYKQIYKDENIENFDLLNPSSKGNPSSTFK